MQSKLIIFKILIIIFLILKFDVVFAQHKAFQLTDTNVQKGDSCYVFPNFSLCERPVCSETLKLCDSIAQFLINNPSVVLEIQMHTDCRDIGSKNDTLTFKRVLQLKNLILENSTIDSNRIHLNGCGERVPRLVTNEINQLYPFLPIGQILDESFIETIKNKKELEKVHDLNRRTLIIVLEK
ncbi:MAG: OmpA family protein [Bacteroidetes bacterium]|nr:OmpA family protein [Bacteroidota bacterium]